MAAAKVKLEHQVAAAVGGIVAGLRETTLEDVTAQLPAHIRAANPSIKSVTKALVSAGWIAVRQAGARVVYRPAPGEGATADLSHNGSDEGSVAADEVRLLIEDVSDLIDARKDITDQIKERWARAKSAGYEPKALKKVMQLMAKKPEERMADDAILEVYLRAMGMME